MTHGATSSHSLYMCARIGGTGTGVSGVPLHAGSLLLPGRHVGHNLACMANKMTSVNDEEEARMAGTTPQETHRLWEERFNGRDIEGLLELYEKDAVFFAQPGQLVEGIDAVRQTLETFIGMDATFTVLEATVGQCGDVALAMAPWTATARGPDGPMDLAGTTTDVMVRGSDGGWRFKIDNPFGTGTS